MLTSPVLTVLYFTLSQSEKWKGCGPRQENYPRRGMQALENNSAVVQLTYSKRAT